MINTAYEAGDIIMRFYEMQSNGVSYKDDASPVTEADQEAEVFIVAALSDAYPQIPIIAEEAVCGGDVPIIEEGGYFFLVDPLDGTKEFIHKRSDFTVNIVLIKDHAPIGGFVYAPARGEMWVGVNGRAEKIVGSQDNFERYFIEIGWKPCGAQRAVVSYSHSNEETEKYLKSLKISERVSVGSSLKFCMIAEGMADIYPRFGRTMEWDTAAGDDVLKYGKINQKSDVAFANPLFIADNKPVNI